MSKAAKGNNAMGKTDNYWEVSNLPCPEKIKCHRCNYVKPKICYSKKQQFELIQHMKDKPSFNAAQTAHAVCTGCTGGQVTELQCYMCDKFKALSGFPKTARRTPDKAECWVCSQERADYEPGGADSDAASTDSGGGSDDEDDGDLYFLDDDAGAALTSTVDGMSLDGSANYRTDTSGSTGGVKVGSSGTYLNSTNGMRSSTAPSVSCGMSTNTSTPGGTFLSGNRVKSSVADSSKSVVSTASSGRFAKIPAVKQKIIFDKAEEEKSKAGFGDPDDDKEFRMPDSDSDDEDE